MQNISSFSLWLSTVLGQPEDQIRYLLADESALQFLITWSLFEAKCFNGFMKVEHIEEYANTTSSICFSELDDIVLNFHLRYQENDFFTKLMHQQNNDELSKIRKKKFSTLCTKEKLFFLLFIVYRYRNNIFHGNKGVQSWLEYRHQINQCTKAMQVLVTHAEKITPSMKYS